MLLNSSELFGTPKYHIMDPVHGGISFFSHEKQVIDHPLFQRLRHIKHNDILHYVFPGATHSRFEHCLGTMHIAGRIFKYMIRNYLINRAQLKISDDQIHAIQYCYGCLRIAALLHDVGHMPFSHQFEESKVGQDLLSNKSVTDALWDSESLNFVGKIPTKPRHEHYSIRFSYDILNEVSNSNSFDFEINDIIGMMEEGKPEPSDKFNNNAKAAILLFSKVPEYVNSLPIKDIGLEIRNLFKDIISGEIDADKMDYLLRDSYFCGCKYGEYNLDHLSQNICLGFDPTGKKPWIGIAVKDKGLGALEDFIHSRFRMYLQVYNHKTVVGLKWLVREAFAEILTCDEYREFIMTALSDTSNFANFTDTYLWEAFRNYAYNTPESACGDLINRKKLCHIAQIKEEADFKKRKKHLALENQLGYTVIRHECSSRFSKISPSFEKIRLLVKDEITKRYHLDTITGNSEFFEKFTDVVITHYYKAPSWYRKEESSNKNYMRLLKSLRSIIPKF